MKFGILICIGVPTIPIPTTPPMCAYVYVCVCVAHHSFYELCVNFKYKTRKSTLINAGKNTHKTFSLILIEFLNSFVIFFSFLMNFLQKETKNSKGGFWVIVAKILKIVYALKLYCSIFYYIAHLTIIKSAKNRKKEVKIM